MIIQISDNFRIWIENCVRYNSNLVFMIACPVLLYFVDAIDETGAYFLQNASRNLSNWLKMNAFSQIENVAVMISVVFSL